MKFKSGDIVVVGGNCGSLEAFTLNVVSNENRALACFGNKYVTKQMPDNYLSLYGRIGEIVRCYISSNGENRIFDGYHVKFTTESKRFVFYRDEIGKASEHEQFLYHIRGSIVVR